MRLRLVLSSGRFLQLLFAWKMKEINCHFDVSEVALKPLNIDDLVYSFFDTEHSNDSSEFAWLELGHSKDVFDMEQE